MENREGDGDGEGDQASGDRRGGIVPGYDNEELFEYCYDQLMNGTRDDRREVVDYLVDEFDEMSLWMVEGFTKFANRDAPQDHQQVDQEDQNEPSTSNPTRKSFRLVKKRSLNVTNQQDQATDDTEPEYNAKVLKRSQDYQKWRMERMTDKEKDEFIERKREYSRNLYHNLSSEEKTRRFWRENELKRQKRLVSEEYREKERETMRKYRARMTEQQKAKERAKDRERQRRKWKNMTEDERKVVRQKNAEAKRNQRNAKKLKKNQK